MWGNVFISLKFVSLNLGFVCCVILLLIISETGLSCGVLIALCVISGEGCSRFHSFVV